MTRILTRITLLGAAIASGAWFTFSSGGTGTAGQPPAAKGTDNRQADRDAIRAMMGQFKEAFQKGDAAAAAGHMTAEAEIISDEGTALKGREAIQKAYAEYFAKGNKPKITIDIDSVRFTSRDTAIEDGHMTVAREGESAETNRYQVLYAREDGKWLISVIKEWPAETTSGLDDLDWLIGTWTAKGKNGEITNTYEWFGNKGFIKASVSVHAKGKTFTAMQLIGTDPATGEFRTWTFEHDGGYGEGTCSQDGNRWVFENRATLTNGSVLETTNILVPVDRNTIAWQPINLTLNGEPIGNLPPTKLTRIQK
ncbi:MAG TPA: SgcJ/EcaC family oxidoreductase [Fimbriiglobus sp.]|jgi:uncharacterized protein (TIGR02246 family)